MRYDLGQEGAYVSTKALMTVEEFAQMNAADNEAYELVMEN